MQNAYRKLKKGKNQNSGVCVLTEIRMGGGRGESSAASNKAVAGEKPMQMQNAEAVPCYLGSAHCTALDERLQNGGG